MATLPPVPVREPALQEYVLPSGLQDGLKPKDPLSGLFLRSWILWFEAIRTAIGNACRKVAGVSLQTQAASISATDLASGMAAGYIRVSYYMRVTRAATTSSSIQVSIKWTDGAVVQTYTGTAKTGNTTTTCETATVFVRADANTAIQYVTSYASVGATAMQYRLDVQAEEVP